MTYGWQHRFVSRFCHLWPIKAVGTTAFMTLFFWGYFSVLHSPSGVPFEMPKLWLDEWIGFSPVAFPIYVSLWVYVSLPPALMGSFRLLVTYGVWTSAMCLLCLAIFWWWPTSTPVVHMNWEQYPGLAMIKGIDAAGNACPSLHVGSAVFSAMWLQHLLLAINTPRWLRASNGVFCVAIAWSTVATGQHVVLDVLAGTVVGAVFGYLSLRHTRRWPERITH